MSRAWVVQEDCWASFPMGATLRHHEALVRRARAGRRETVVQQGPRAVSAIRQYHSIQSTRARLTRNY